MGDEIDKNQNVLVPVETFEKLAKYLVQKPYSEVMHLIPLLSNLELQKKEETGEPKEGGE